MASSSTAPAEGPPQLATSLRVESVTVVALERPEDGGLLLRVLPNVAPRPRVGSGSSAVSSIDGGNASAGGAGLPLPGFGGLSATDLEQDDWEVPNEPACDALVSRLRATKHPGKDSGGLCVICAEDIVECGTPVVTLGCQHVFHEDCIRRWLKKRHTCPTCRLELEVDDVKYLRSIGMKDEADALEKAENERLDRERQQQAAERRRWVDSMRRGDPVHFGLSCSSCSVSPLVGDCYRCSRCEDFVLCNECYKTREECHDRTHEFTPFGAMPHGPGEPASGPGLLTVLVPPPARLPHTDSAAAEGQGQAAMAAAEVAFAAVRSLALAPLAGGNPAGGPTAGPRASPGRGSGR